MAAKPIPYSGPIVTRAEAMASGAKRYFIGEPCKRSHVVEREVLRGRCTECRYLDHLRARPRKPNGQFEESTRQRFRADDPNCPSWMICKVAGCDTPVRSRHATLCNTHYFRGRRTGSLAERKRAPPSLTNHGYLASNHKGHPAASSTGMLYEHRRVFYETKGPNDHHCYWCAITLMWGGVGKGKVHVDHLDGVKTNNDEGNLVASCHRCNVNRGLFMRWVSEHKDDPVLWRMYSSAKEKQT